MTRNVCYTQTHANANSHYEILIEQCILQNVNLKYVHARK